MENAGVRRVAARLLCCVAVLSGCDREAPAPSATTGPASQPSGAREVRIAAASDLKFALEEVVDAFRRTHPGISVTTTYGSSGNFYAQLSNDAPFDLFLSADLSYPQKLIESGKGSKETLFRYAVGRLVVWTPAGSTLDVQSQGLRALADPSVRKVAIANPQHAPYGRAAEAAMRSAGVYDAVKDKLVLGENVAQAAQFVQSGAADVGVIAHSLAVAPPMRGKGRSFDVPPDAHPRIEQGGVILSRAKDPAAALAFGAFLLSPDGKAILKSYGFADAPQ